MGKMRLGKIVDIQGHGGIVVVVLESEGETLRLFGDNGPTVRALHGILDGGVIGPGHTFDPEAVIGQEISFCPEGGMLGILGRPEQAGEDSEDEA